MKTFLYISAVFLVAESLTLRDIVYPKPGSCMSDVRQCFHDVYIDAFDLFPRGIPPHGWSMLNLDAMCTRIASPWIDCVDPIIETCSDLIWNGMEKKQVVAVKHFLRYACSTEGLQNVQAFVEDSCTQNQTQLYYLIHTMRGCVLDHEAHEIKEFFEALFGGGTDNSLTCTLFGRIEGCVQIIEDHEVSAFYEALLGDVNEGTLTCTHFEEIGTCMRTAARNTCGPFYETITGVIFNIIRDTIIDDVDCPDPIIVASSAMN